jgi:hypothetical protein
MSAPKAYGYIKRGSGRGCDRRACASLKTH